MAEANWYVVHTYSGYENKVKQNIEKTIENRNLQDLILEVSVPMETVIEIKGDVKKPVERKLFPGYVFVNMVMNDDTWYVVRNTRGVTGFVGPGSKPVPLTPQEMANMGVGGGFDIKVGDTIEVTSEPWLGLVAEVKQVNMDKECVTINVDMLGRENLVEISFSYIKKI